MATNKKQMKKIITTTLLAGACAINFMACKGNAPSGEQQTDSIKTENIKPTPTKPTGKLLEYDSFSVIVPKGWTGIITRQSIEVKKPIPGNESRVSIHIESLVFDMPLEAYVEQSEMTDEQKLGEYIFGEYKWIAYDRSERGYPVVYLTAYPSLDRVLCVGASGIDVQSAGNPDIESFLRGITLK